MLYRPCLTRDEISLIPNNIINEKRRRRKEEFNRAVTMHNLQLDFPTDEEFIKEMKQFGRPITGAEKG